MTTKSYTNALQYERFQNALQKAISPPITFSTHCIKGVPIPLIEPYRADYSRINELEELLKMALIRDGGLESYLAQYAPQLEQLKALKDDWEYSDIVEDMVSEFPELEAYFYSDELEEESGK